MSRPDRCSSTPVSRMLVNAKRLPSALNPIQVITGEAGSVDIHVHDAGLWAFAPELCFAVTDTVEHVDPVKLFSEHGVVVEQVGLFRFVAERFFHQVEGLARTVRIAQHRGFHRRK